MQNEVTRQNDIRYTEIPRPYLRKKGESRDEYIKRIFFDGRDTVPLDEGMIVRG